MQKAFLVLLLLPLVILTGCDPIYGVTRSARLQFMPEPGKVGEAIKATPGVDNVEYRFEEGGRPVTFRYGIKPTPDQVHRFIYKGGTNVHGSVVFVESYDHTVWYYQSLRRMGSPPPQAWIDATLPTMKQIETELEKNCGLTNLQSIVVQHCFGVKCK